MKRGIIVILLSLALIYAGDTFWAEYRKVKKQDLFGTVEIKRYYAIAQKNNHVEFVYDDPESQECINALFSHFDHPPCWFLSRHNEQRIDE